eukprot:7875193-Heterocapsa_arctica.AAC.1
MHGYLPARPPLGPSSLAAGGPPPGGRGPRGAGDSSSSRWPGPVPTGGILGRIPTGREQDYSGRVPKGMHRSVELEWSLRRLFLRGDQRLQTGTLCAGPAREFAHGTGPRPFPGRPDSSDRHPEPLQGARTCPRG